MSEEVKEETKQMTKVRNVKKNRKRREKVDVPKAPKQELKFMYPNSLLEKVK